MIAPAIHPSISGVLLRKARPEDALCLSVLAMQVFLDTYATEGIRPAIAREVLSSFSRAVFDSLAHAEEVASAAGATVLWLTPWVHNHRALAFYERRDHEDHGITLFTF